MEVLRIKAIDTYPIRLRMLRPDGVLQDCVFPNDHDELTFHLGAFIDNKLVSIASFYFENHTQFPQLHQYRLRGMATLPEYQRLGLSASLLRIAFPVIKQNQCQLLWCNARISAKGFYEKMGFQASGEEFEIPSIGPHILMAIEI